MIWALLWMRKGEVMYLLFGLESFSFVVIGLFPEFLEYFLIFFVLGKGCIDVLSQFFPIFPKVDKLWFSSFAIGFLCVDYFSSDKIWTINKHTFKILSEKESN